MLSKEDQYWFVEDIPKISECLRDLKDAINERNKFAHGTIVIDEEKMKVVLRYNECGQQEVVLDEEMMESVMSRMPSVYSWLEYLHPQFSHSIVTR